MHISRSLLLRLAVTFAAVFIGMAVFETLKQFFWPNINVWQSHAITILFSSFISISSAYFIFRHADFLQQRLSKELAERKIAQDSLQQSEEDLRTTLNSIGDAVIATDGLGRVTRMNPVAEQLTGWTFSDARSRPLDEVFNIRCEDTGGTVESPVRKVLRDGVVVGLANHTELIARDGKKRPIADSGAPIRDAAGNIFGVVLVFRDQSSEREAERLLRQSEGLMKTLITNLPVELWAMDKSGAYILQNPASKKAWGEQIGAQARDVQIDPVVLAKWDATNRRAFAGEVTNGEWEWTHPAKGLRIFHEVVAPIYEGAEIRGILGVNIDVTEQQRAMNALRQSEERLQLVLRGTHDGVWDRNLVTNEIVYSDRFIELTGYSKRDVQNTFSFFEERLHPDDRERVLNTIADHLERRTPYEVEYRLRAKTSEYRWFYSRGQAIWNAEGRPIRMAGSIGDITCRKQAEAELLAYQQQLQSLSSRLLIIEERERRSFSRLLHDHIGQNLTYAKLKLGVLRTQVTEREVLETVSEILELIEQMSQQTRSLTYELSPPLLYEIGLDAALEWLGESFQARFGVQFNFEGFDAPETLDVDKRIVLFQAARELLFNVVKHSQAKTATISTPRSENCVSLTVSDDGVGFDPSKMALSKESGFGLFNVRERMHYIGGKVEIESRPSAGARVTLILPLNQNRSC